MYKLGKFLLFFGLVLLIAIPVLAQTENDNSQPFWNIKPVYFYKTELQNIDGQTLTVLYKNKTYTILVTDKTKLLRNFGSKSNLKEFGVGSILQIYGRRENNTIIEAQLIRNKSIQKRKGTLVGNIVSLDTATQKFVIKSSNRTNITVTVDATTKILQQNTAKSFSDLVLGVKVVATGMWDKSNSTLTEVSKVVIMPAIKSTTTPVQ